MSNEIHYDTDSIKKLGLTKLYILSRIYDFALKSQKNKFLQTQYFSLLLVSYNVVLSLKWMRNE